MKQGRVKHSYRVAHIALEPSMSELQTKLPSNTWVVANWDEYIQTIEQQASEKPRVTITMDNSESK
jgi:hypothetical protein